MVAEITPEEKKMLRNSIVVGATLAMLLMAGVPVLAQVDDGLPPENDPRVYADSENPNRDSSLVYSPELETYVDCSFSFFDPEKTQFCLDNGVIPSCTYGKSEETPGGIIAACVGNFDFGRAGFESEEDLLGSLQYDNSEPREQLLQNNFP